MWSDGKNDERLAVFEQRLGLLDGERFRIGQVLEPGEVLAQLSFACQKLRTEIRD